MNIRRFVFIFLVALIFGAFSAFQSSQAATVKSDQAVTISDPISDDAFISGKSIEVKSTINGELVVSGQDITINGQPNRSVFAAGETIHLNQGSGYNAFIAGNKIVVKGTINHDAYIAGNDITFDPSSEVKGNLRVAGNSVALSGKIDKGAVVKANTTHSNASIIGSFVVQGTDLTFTGGSVDGDFSFTSKQNASGLDKVTIKGKTEHFSPMNDVRPLIQGKILFLLFTLIMGSALILLSPHQIKESVEGLKTQWTRYLLNGALIFIITPIGFAVLLATVVGIPIALIVIALYGIVLYIASIISTIIVGNITLSVARFQRRDWWVSLIVGVLLIAFLENIPVIGWLISLIVFIAVTLPTLGVLVEWWRKKLA